MQRIGITGSITSPLLLGFPGILASIGFSMMSHKKIAEPTAEYIAKSGKSEQIISLYEFKKDVDLWYEKIYK